MFFSDETRAWSSAIFANATVSQIAPLLLVFLIPFLVFSLASAANGRHLFYSLAMVLEHFVLPWNWANAHSTSAPAHQRKKPKKSHIRSGSRGDQSAQNGSAKHPRTKDDKPPGYYPGLTNISGTYCFMNSTIQALASLSYLQPQIDMIHAKAEALDVPSPVIDAVRDLLHALNTPHSRPTSIDPSDIIRALSHYSTGKTHSLFSSRDHQDAQELFQFLSECIKTETAAIDKEGQRDPGLGGLAELKEISRDIGKSVFDGLTANRRSCIECGYTEAVMHFAFDNWQLAVPRSSGSYKLEDCLADYTRLELLTDCMCRKCSMLATHKRLLHEAERLAEATKSETNASSSKKRRLRDVRKMIAAVKDALECGRIEEDIKGLRMERVLSKASTKQAMIARPPPVLALHINRSVHFGQYAAKNNIRVIFPEVLDLTPFTTSGKLSTEASAPISSPPPSLPRSTTPTPATYATPRTLYRLSAVVCHYGQHSFGHYICFRRTPRPLSTGPKRFAPPTLSDPLAYAQDNNTNDPNAPPLVWDDEEQPPPPGRGWLRISDEVTRECGIETVLGEGAGAFMLYYERVAQPRLGFHYPVRGSSEETLKAETLTLRANGSAVSLAPAGDDASSSSSVVGGVGVSAGTAGAGAGAVSAGCVVGVGVGETKKAVERVPGARVVRSVAAGRGRGRSMSAAPSLEERAKEQEKENGRVRESSAGPSSRAVSGTLAVAGSSIPNGAAVNGDAAPAPAHADGQKVPLKKAVNGDAHVNGEARSPPPSLPPPPSLRLPEDTSSGSPTSPAVPVTNSIHLVDLPTDSSSTSPAHNSPNSIHLVDLPTDSSSTSPAHNSPKERPPTRIQSPKPIYPSARPAMVGLKA